jgi:hypothetical protein
VTYTPTERQPTGIPAAPLIMVSGFAKSGKSLTSYKLADSPRIERCWVVDLGEGSADEYGGDEGDPPYTILNWGGFFSTLKDTIAWCIAQKPADERLNAVILDSGTELWDDLKKRANTRARGSAKNKKALENDPDFEVDVSMPYWNDAKSTWAEILMPLKMCPHVVGVVLARSDEVAEVVGGQPTKNKIISYQVEKTTQGLVTAHITVDMDHKARLVEVRSKHVSVPPKGMALGANPLAEVVELLSPKGGFAAPQVQRALDDGRDDPEIEEFWGRLVPHAKDDIGQQMRDFAAENACELTKVALRSDRGWFENARDLLAQLEGAS